MSRQPGGEVSGKSLILRAGILYFRQWRSCSRVRGKGQGKRKEQGFIRLSANDNLVKSLRKDDFVKSSPAKAGQGAQKLRSEAHLSRVSRDSDEVEAQQVDFLRSHQPMEGRPTIPEGLRSPLFVERDFEFVAEAEEGRTPLSLIELL
jgi:hypothetical protein